MVFLNRSMKLNQQHRNTPRQQSSPAHCEKALIPTIVYTMSSYTTYSSRKMKKNAATHSTSSNKSKTTQKSSNRSVSGISLGFTLQTQNSHTFNDPPVSEFKLAPSIRSKQFSSQSTKSCSVTSESTTSWRGSKAGGSVERGPKSSTSTRKGSSIQSFQKWNKDVGSPRRDYDVRTKAHLDNPCFLVKVFQSAYLSYSPFPFIHSFFFSFDCHFVCDDKHKLHG